MSLSKEEIGLSQPAKAIIVQLLTETDLELCDLLVQTLTDYFSLICSLNGSSKVVFFGLVAIGSGNKMHIVLPLQHTRSNFSRIHDGLKDLNSLAREWIENPDDQNDGAITGPYNGSLRLGIDECVNMFKRQAFSFLQAAGYWSQLKIFLFGSDISSSQMKDVNRIGRTLDTQLVCCLQVVSVASLKGCCVADVKTSQDSDVMNFDIDELIDGCEIVESKALEMNRLSLLKFFMSWFHENTTDMEYLHVNFPNNKLLIKCDIRERMINPASFGSFYRRYNLTTSDSSMKIITGGGGTKTCQNRNILQLDIVSRVPIEGICDSVIFGVPLIVQATTCWKMDWDELETNRKNFLALCHLLGQRNETLIVKLAESSAAVPYGVAGSRQKPGPKPQITEQPRGYFVLLPSSNQSVLLKSILGSEMLLPIEFPLLESVTQDNLSVVSETLDEVNRTDSYNPLSHSTDLHSCLASQLIPSNQKSKRGLSLSSHEPIQMKKSMAAESYSQCDRVPLVASSYHVGVVQPQVQGRFGYQVSVRPGGSGSERGGQGRGRAGPRKLYNSTEYLFESGFPTEL